MKILIIHGPHLSLLGKVSSKNNFRLTLGKVDRQLRRIAKDNDIALKIFQHFDRKNILKSVLTNRNDVDGIILNLGGMGRGFYALTEMLAIIDLPVVEVMVSEFPYAKENFDHSVIQEVAARRIFKKGLEAYEDALDFFIKQWKDAA